MRGEDHKFGYFDIGALVTVPLTSVPSRFGTWNVHFGGDYFLLGDTPEAFNVGTDGDPSKHKVVGLVGFWRDVLTRAAPARDSCRDDGCRDKEGHGFRVVALFHCRHRRSTIPYRLTRRCWRIR